MIIVLEGFIVGATKIFFERARAKAREEGVQQGVQQGVEQGVQQERERLRKAGVRIPPDKPKAEDGDASKKS